MREEVRVAERGVHKIGHNLEPAVFPSTQCALASNHHAAVGGRPNVLNGIHSRLDGDQLYKLAVDISREATAGEHPHGAGLVDHQFMYIIAGEPGGVVDGKVREAVAG